MGLREIINEVVSESADTDPREVAESVIDRIPRGGIKAALVEALPFMTRQVMQESRRNRGASFGVPKPGRSWKADGVRDWWTHRMDSRWYISDGETSTWRRLRDMTYADLMFCAAERRQKAQDTLAVAESFEQLAALVKKHKAQRVEDLPREAVAPVFGEAA